MIMVDVRMSTGGRAVTRGRFHTGGLASSPTLTQAGIARAGRRTPHSGSGRVAAVHTGGTPLSWDSGSVVHRDTGRSAKGSRLPHSLGHCPGDWRQKPCASTTPQSPELNPMPKLYVHYPSTKDENVLHTLVLTMEWTDATRVQDLCRVRGSGTRGSTQSRSLMDREPQCILLPHFVPSRAGD